ncbi:zinc-ribbon domain-containing protein [Pararoseomonas indoligenes]|uniref:Zinc-ribbon domain-containing protein n=1 Tax=Roseomonas indoligenes TaxID=2820811 RepID=A0A940S9T0_9PROT|nr:zinc-ribbon domain-containing protein [Pararoseomonas indoligenes]MBP0495613.1 zinc-ribbon domain-containing protein [Pararoseomonas indoligenes]
MRVACPECSAEYDLPPALADRLASRPDGARTVRCARCGTAWAPRPEAPAPAPPPEDAPAPPPTASADTTPFPAFPIIERPDDHAPPPPPAPLPRRGRAPALAWAASLLLLAGAAAAAWHWRIDVVEAWPPAARAYVALGLAG